MHVSASLKSIQRNGGKQRFGTVSELQGRRRLRSAGRGHLDFPRVRCDMENGHLPTLAHHPLETHYVTI